MNRERFFAACAALLLESLTGLAELDRLPIRDKEDWFEHALLHTTDISIQLEVRDSSGSIVWRQWDFNRYKKPDGTEESINALSRRSKTEFEALISRILREAVRVAVDTNSVALSGKTLDLACWLMKDIRYLPNPGIPVVVFGIWVKYAPLVWNEEGGYIVVPEWFFEVDLYKPTNGQPNVGSTVIAAGVLSGKVFFAGQAWPEYPGEWLLEPHTYTLYTAPEKDIVSIYPEWIVDKEYKNGTVELIFRGGVKQVFDLWDGHLIETIRPQMVPVSITLSSEGVEVSVDSTETVVIDFAPTLPPRWEEMKQTASFRKSSAGSAYFFPSNGKSGFFQARVAQ